MTMEWHYWSESQLIVSQFDTEEVNVTLPGGDGNGRAFKIMVRRWWWEREGQGLQSKEGGGGGGGRKDRAFKVRRGREGQGLQGKEGVVGTGRTGPSR